MAKGFVDKILDQIFDADWVGRRGEKLTERELKLVKLFGRDGKVLRNVYVPKGNGETSEIDVVFITQQLSSLPFHERRISAYNVRRR